MAGGIPPAQGGLKSTIAVQQLNLTHFQVTMLEGLQIMFNQLDDEMKELECNDAGAIDNDLFYWSMQREVIQSGKTVWHPR